MSKGTIDGPAKVPPGLYVVKFLFSETGIQWGNPKLTARFVVLSPEKWQGCELCRHYNIKELLSPPGRNGTFVAKARGALRKEMACMPGVVAGRDAIDLCELHGQEISVEVRTTEKDGTGAKLGDDAYSVIARVLGPANDPN